MKQKFVINGTDYAKFIAELSWTRNDLDSDKSERTMDGIMHRQRITTKIKLGITFGILSHSELMGINAALLPETLNISYIDAISGDVTKQFYASQVDAAVQIVQGGELYWTGAKVNLTEV